MAKGRNGWLFTGDRPRGPVCRMVSAYVRGNALPPGQLVSLIATVSAAVEKLGRPPDRVEGVTPSPVTPTPVATQVAIRSSVTPDGLRSFEDGVLYRTLRRHLRSRGLDPDAYRTKWGLPSDYPMTCAAYSARRSDIARQYRLGHVSRT